MQEFLYVCGAILLAGIVLTVLAVRIGAVLAKLEHLLTYVATGIILFVMVFICAEVIMRYGFNSPIPGHLEGSELLMPMIVFLAMSYTQATHGHVGMDLVLDMLRPNTKRYATMATLLASIFICAVLAYFSGKNALQLFRFDDVTMTPPYFKTWPSGAAIAVGYTLISVRMYIQLLHLFKPDRFPANEPANGFHAVE